MTHAIDKFKVMNTTAKSEQPAVYAVTRAAVRKDDDDGVIAQALAILAGRVMGREAMNSPQDVKNFLTLKIAALEQEVFGVLFLDSQNRVIAFEILFTGTLTQTSVYPREVVKRALSLNAGAVILSHNHPSGEPEPSRADEMITMTLKSALALVDVWVLDHIVVSASGTVSFAERGLI